MGWISRERDNKPTWRSGEAQTAKGPRRHLEEGINLVDDEKMALSRLKAFVSGSSLKNKACSVDIVGPALHLH